MFGYRTLGFGAHTRAVVASGIDFTTTVTIGTNNTKSGHYSYGFDTSTIHDNNAIGSIADNQIAGMTYDDGSGGVSDDFRIGRVVYHNVPSTSTDTRFRIRIYDATGELTGNLLNLHSNIFEGTITIGSTVYTLGTTEAYNLGCSADGGDEDHSWQDASNSVGTSGTVTIRIQSA